jgi:hypothetical protein
MWDILFNARRSPTPSARSFSYRAMVLKERRINKRMKIGAIEQGIRIIPDGQTCRMLGAWIGNNAPYTTPWPSVLEKITGDLERWKMTSPSLEGKRHIINMVIGGRTHVLAAFPLLSGEFETIDPHLAIAPAPPNIAVPGQTLRCRYLRRLRGPAWRPRAGWCRTRK